MERGSADQNTGTIIIQQSKMQSKSTVNYQEGYFIMPKVQFIRKIISLLKGLKINNKGKINKAHGETDVTINMPGDSDKCSPAMGESSRQN